MSKKSKVRSNQVFTEGLLLSEDSPFSVKEAYKTLRTNVIFSLPGSECKCIGVTSATRGEGKSTIALNLAISLAQLNKRVILIDCDLRLPTILTKLNLKNQEGLSNYLSGMIDYIPVVRIKKRNIDVIPSGMIPPDATALINSEEMLKMLKTLEKSYEFIIFDFPPINIVSDAVLLSSEMDGYLIVAREEVSRFQQLVETFRQTRLVGAKIIGFVYNGKIEEKKMYKRKKYYGSYYYYNYYKKGY